MWHVPLVNDVSEFRSSTTSGLLCSFAPEPSGATFSLVSGPESPAVGVPSSPMVAAAGWTLQKEGGLAAGPACQDFKILNNCSKLS